MSECESTDLEGVNSELQEELCWCMLQEAKKTYPKGPPNSKDWDTLWAKEAGDGREHPAMIAKKSRR